MHALFLSLILLPSLAPSQDTRDLAVQHGEIRRDIADTQGMFRNHERQVARDVRSLQEAQQAFIESMDALAQAIRLLEGSHGKELAAVRDLLISIATILFGIHKFRPDVLERVGRRNGK